MWSILIIVFVATCVEGQNGDSHDHGHGWDIRLAVPGEPGSDYPTLGAIPRTSFSCAGKEPGYYADLETSCQVFRVCTIGSTYGFQSFLCPNGTLFNQAVFVCDWWMNVRCEKSQQQNFESNGERFGNLRLGPQLMKDIKKMLTHPMRNPYDKREMRNNIIVMQDYKPPFGQLFPNGALLANPDRTPNNVYVPAKQIQGFSQNNYNENDIAFAASTPNPRYLPAAYNNFQSNQDVETFQRQRQNGQYVQRLIQNTQTRQQGNIVSNGHTGQITQSPFSHVTQPTQGYNQINAQFGQRQRNNFVSNLNMQNAINTQRGQLNRQNSQYTNGKKLAQLNSGKQSELGVALSRQQSNYNSNQGIQPYVYNAPPPRSPNEIAQNEVRQNLVSTTNPAPTIIAKTLTLSRLVEDPKPGKPKSRITVKTWIVKPSKSAKLINPTPYTYDRPTPTERLVASNTPYVYNPPTMPQSARIVQEPQPYVYNKPTAAARLIVTTTPRPTEAYTTPRPTAPSRQYLTPPPPPPPTRASRLYLAPTTFKPAARLYLPPSNNEPATPAQFSRQILPTNPIQQPTISAQLRASPTTPTPTYTVGTTTQTNTRSPTFSLTKQSHVNANHNNLSFTDILTKEKLDITVNDIVKHTSNFLNTASPAQYGQLRQDVASLDYLEDNNYYLPPGGNTESDEILTTTESTTTPSKSAKLISPSIDLEPPEETFQNNQNTNQISNLPFYKEQPPATNTIERTVSLKISIPEKVATYLFNRRNETDYDRLEILNTGSSNYLVLSNNPFVNNVGNNFIPIGRLIEDRNSNISNSQALVYSLLADSINVAKEYNNIAKQEVSSSLPLQSTLQNVNDEEITQITNRISQLTSSQYAGNNYNNINANSVPTTQSTSTTSNVHAEISDNNIQNQIQPTQQFSMPQQNNQQQNFARYQTGTNNLNSNLINSNQNQVYSGQYYQYPVPDVTNQIYNRQSSANLIQSNVQSQNTNVNNNLNNLVKPTSAHVEIVPSQTLPVAPAPARLQLPPTQQNEDISNEEIKDLLRTGNGIAAQVEDKIVGTIPHPLENDKVVSYKKDQTYYLYSKLDNSIVQNIGNNIASNKVNGQQQSAKLIQNDNIPNFVALQFVPSVGYQLEDEKEQQRILNAFQIDEFGSPKQKTNQNTNERQETLISDVNYTVDHSIPNKQVSGQYNDINTLYAGPSSYAAPQASVGNLGVKQTNNFNSRLELEDNGYQRVSPARQFTF